MKLKEADELLTEIMFDCSIPTLDRVTAFLVTLQLVKQKAIKSGLIPQYWKEKLIV
jgi:hypothetical protein